LGPQGWQYSNMGSCDRKMANAKRQLNVKLYNHFNIYFPRKEAIQPETLTTSWRTLNKIQAQEVKTNFYSGHDIP
jgi:hypothetical protein